jgi:hypothetical protein
LCTTVDGLQRAVYLMGSACKWNDDCVSSYCIPQSETETGLAWTDGMCSSECGKCQTGFTCTALGDKSLCLPKCGSEVPCRNGYVCNPTLSVCLPDCRLGFDCGNSLTCGWDGVCAL